MIASVIVNYFGHRLVQSAAESLLRDRPDMEVIVVDNSMDAEESRQLRQVLDSRVKVITNDCNTGFGAACNTGISSTQAEFIMLLNPDTQVRAGCMDKLQAALASNPALGAVSPVQLWEPAGHWKLPPAWLPSGVEMWCIEQAWRSRKVAAKMSNAYRNLALRIWRPDNSAQLIPQRALSGGAMLLRRSAALQNGSAFDPAFFMYYEDSDLCWRLKKAGWQLGIVPDAYVLHEWEHTSAKVEFMEKSKQIYIDKHFAGRGAWQQRTARCMQATPLAAPLDCQEHDNSSPALEVPPAWQNGWLLEISPSALLIPALGCLGRGPWAEIPVHLTERLGSGPLYARIGPDTPVSNTRLPVFRLV
ncbi:glycosyltransferase family 2 protein [Acidovorax sp. CCYZU-2555]|uniref:glycosyltransferase family 2 protein n=1 Tax=Acidovorax sp. CCYZU-2555 TaxID=2835042 RepID=UPI001BCC7182|nr:glycosyltransferase family 2 protein [Acidovorax sp. CCYZU-2555]MBS7777105.1 glycosyltransferase family 2 protein [Acidovorax sp. CCYZU-2555]